MDENELHDVIASTSSKRVARLLTENAAIRTVASKNMKW